MIEERFSVSKSYAHAMNWESEKDMARDVEENKELYEALADEEDSTDT